MNFFDPSDVQILSTQSECEAIRLESHYSELGFKNWKGMGGVSEVTRILNRPVFDEILR